MIRLYQESDIEDIIEIWYQASLVAHPFLSENFLAEEKRRIRQLYLPNAQTWVYERQGKPVGFISLIDNEVGGLFVHPSMQRRGIGSALMDKACSLHETVELDVFEANAVGRAFYSKYGFVSIRRFTHGETGEPTIRLCYGPGQGS
jgi:putative acetyltransferase